MEDLAQAKAKAEEELAAIRETLEKLQAGQSDDSSKLEVVHAEVCNTYLFCDALVLMISAVGGVQGCECGTG